MGPSRRLSDVVAGADRAVRGAGAGRWGRAAGAGGGRVPVDAHRRRLPTHDVRQPPVRLPAQPQERRPEEFPPGAQLGLPRPAARLGRQGRPAAQGNDDIAQPSNTDLAKDPHVSTSIGLRSTGIEF